MEDHGMSDVVGKPDCRGFDIVWKNDGDPDVLMRVRNDETGQAITMLIRLAMKAAEPYFGT